MPDVGTGGATAVRLQQALGTLEGTNAVTRRAVVAAAGLSSLATARSLRELQQPNLCTGANLADMTHNRELFT